MKIFTIAFALSISSVLTSTSSYGETLTDGLRVGPNNLPNNYSYSAGAFIGDGNIVGASWATPYNFLAVGTGNQLYYASDTIVAGISNSGEYGSSLIVGSYDMSIAYDSLVVGNSNSGYVERGILAGSNNYVTGAHRFVFGRGLLDHVSSVGMWPTDDIPAVYLGQYNLTDQGGTWPLLIIGNGTDATHPSNALEVLRNGNVNLRSGKLNLFTSGTATTPTIVIDPVASTIKINGQSVITASTNGNVGFGTTSPSQPLTISNSAPNKLLLTGGASQNGMQFDSVSGANQFYLYTGAAFNGGGFGVYNAASGLQPFSILNNGNIGIGTTTPIASLDVNGKAILRNNMKIFGTSESWAEGLTVIQPSGWGGIRLTRNDPATGTYHGNWAIGYTGYTGNDFSISNFANGVQHDGLIHISSSTQNVGINSVTPSEKLTVVDSGDLNPFSGTLGVYAHNLTQGITIGYTGITKTGSNQNGDLAINAKGTGNLVLQTNASGNVGIGTTNPVSNLHILGNAKSNSNVDAGGNSNLTIETSEAGRTPGKGAAIGFVVPADTNGGNHWEQGRILVTPDNGNQGDAHGRMYLQTRYYETNAWKWRDNIIMKANGAVSIPKRQGDILMGEFGTPGSND